MTENDRLEGRLAAVLALARGRTVTEAAKDGQVSDRTVRRWLAEDDEFRAEITKARGELLGRIVGQLTDAASEAVETLRAALAGESPSVQVRAAQTILTSMLAARDALDVEERLSALEAAQHGAVQ